MTLGLFTFANENFKLKLYFLYSAGCCHIYKQSNRKLNSDTTEAAIQRYS